MEKLKYLFQPIKVGKMEVKNRVVMPGMGMGFGLDDDGYVNEQLTEFYVERARGGPGMMTVGGAAVEPMGLITPRGCEILWDDGVIPGFTEMVKAVHQYDVKFGIQLIHAGLQAYYNQPIGPSSDSPLPKFTYSAADAVKVAPKGLTQDGIRDVVTAFGKAAERCVKAGFDFVEINAGHGYLVCQFLSPWFNRRTDEYGGSFENRIRFFLDIIREMRERTGDAVPIGARINGDDFQKEGGWKLEDACRLAPILEKAGLAYLNVSAGTYDTGYISLMPMYRDQGAIVYLAEEVKKHVSIPVMAVGRIKDPSMADRLIKEGRADLVAMGRAHLADPLIVDKARNDQLADIRPCIGCARGCVDRASRQAKAGDLDTAISCAVNPRIGRELFIKEIPGEKKNAAKKVLVAGAGCAGLEAARAAAFDGHDVVVCDSRSAIGGQIRWAVMMPKRQEMGETVQWYQRQLGKLGVEIRLNTTVDEALLDEMKPDVVILATGSLPEAPLGFVTGFENLKEIDMFMFDDLLEDRRLAGDQVLIVGSDQIGAQLADLLSEQGKTVHLAGKDWSIGGNMASVDSYYLAQRLKSKGIKRYVNVQQIDISPVDEIWITTDRDKQKVEGIETIVLAGDRRPNVFLAEIAEKKGMEVRVVGDACPPSTPDYGTVYAAIATAYEAGRGI